MDKRPCIIALVFSIVIQIHVVHGTDTLAADYCRRSRDPILGLEGFFHKNYNLQKVHIFINGADFIPGNQPTVPVGDIKYAQKTGKLTITEIIQQRKLAQYIIRMYSNILTARSCKMQSYPVYFLGGYKKAFIQELRNGSNFEVTDHVIQSPLIATEVLEQACGNLSKILNDIIFNVPMEILKLLNLDSYDTAVKTQTLKWIPILLCNKSRNFDKKFLNWEQSSISRAFSIINDNYNLIRRNKNISHFSRICVNPLIDFLIMELKTDGAVDPLTVYHVNDALFTSIMLTLTRGRLQIPRPTSRLVFEVYGRGTGTNPPKYIRVLYNGQDITHEVPMCNKMASRHSPCRLKYFTDFNKTLI